jgi:hypothetical protein
MPDSNLAHPIRESAQAEFPHGLLVICFGLVVGQVVLERFQAPLDCGDRLLMNFLIKRVDCLASGLDAFGRAYDAADDPGDGAANHARRL